jgi:hypothetical protein
VAGNLAAIPNPRPLLNLDKRADLHVIADLTPIQVRETKDADAFAQLDVRRDLLKWRTLAHQSGFANLQI